MIFLDASALISMMAGEPDADALADLMGNERIRITSPLAMWETSAGLCRSYSFSPETARDTLRSFLSAHEVAVASIGEREFDLASAAYAAFGKGRHPAALNMGDCFAYACAKSHRASLLFKGDDFSKTDIRLPSVH